MGCRIRGEEEAARTGDDFRFTEASDRGRGLWTGSDSQGLEEDLPGERHGPMEAIFCPTCSAGYTWTRLGPSVATPEFDGAKRGTSNVDSSLINSPYEEDVPFQLGVLLMKSLHLLAGDPKSFLKISVLSEVDSQVRSLVDSTVPDSLSESMCFLWTKQNQAPARSLNRTQAIPSSRPFSGR